MRVNQKIILLILFLSCLTGCTQDKKLNTLFENPGYDFPYQLDEPINHGSCQMHWLKSQA